MTPLFRLLYRIFCMRRCDETIKPVEEKHMETIYQAIDKNYRGEWK